jgi:hypothetical protein
MVHHSFQHKRSKGAVEEKLKTRRPELKTENVKVKSPNAGLVLSSEF